MNWNKIVIRFQFGLLLFVNISLLSQERILQFEKLSIEDGLSHNSINCFLHDSRGFLWIGTFEGLNLYNGYDIKIFRSDEQNPNTLSNNFIECITEDHEGNIWIGTQNGLNKYDYRTGNFTRYSPDWNSNTSLNHNVIKDLLHDKNNNLWIAFYGGGIAKYNFEKDEFKQFKEDTTAHGLKSSFINDLYEDHTGNIWLGTWLQGLIKFNPETETFEQFIYDNKESEDFAKYNTINTILEGDRGVLWLGTWEKGIITFDTRKNSFGTLPEQINSYKKFNETIIRSILPITTKKIMVGTYQRGLFIINTEDPLSYKIENHSHDLANSQSISNNSIWSLYRDRSGICWIGTWGGGVNKLDFNKNRFNSYQSMSHFKKWLSHYLVSSFVELDNGDIFIGTIDGGFYKFLKNKHEFINLSKKAKDFEDAGIISMIKDVDNNIWIGTKNGLFYFNTSNNQIQKFNKDVNDQKLTTNDISKVFIDSENNIWVGTWNAGINKLVPQNNNNSRFIIEYYQFVESDSTTVSSNSISYFYQDHYGVIWVGTSGGGINIYKPEAKSFQRMNVYNDKSNRVIADIACIFEDSQGEFWIGSFSEGLCNLNRQTGFVEVFNIENGLSNNGVFSILEDDNHNLWLGTGFGISCFKRDLKEFKNYYSKDGLHGNTFNTTVLGAHLKNRNGELLFGGENGFTSFNPVEIIENNYVPEVYITKLLVNGREITVGDTLNKYCILNTPIEFMEKLDLSYNDQVVAFEFSSLHYATPINNQYQYKLEGFDKNWISTDSDRRFASYTNLSPGEYTFSVRATNNDGLWNDKSTCSIRLIVHPPYWNTYWFKGLILLSIILVIFIYLRSQFRLKNFQMSVQDKLHEAEQIISEKQLIKLKNDKLDAQLESKTKELASNTLYLNQKNERLKIIKNYILEIIPNATSEKVKVSLAKLDKIIEDDIMQEENWENFEKSFDVLHDDFMKRFTKEFPKVTHKDLKTVGYIRQNYSNKEIAEMLNISLRSLESSRYRLRKKMNLPPETNLNDFIIRF